jgi:hypothetical protein
MLLGLTSQHLEGYDCACSTRFTHQEDTMTKTEAIARAEAARHAAKLALARHALYTESFGSNDKRAQEAMLERDVALEAHNRWMDIAHLHPKTRAALVPKLPAYLFAY